jgi:glycerophosphoryl diester phosphodiesterase
MRPHSDSFDEPSAPATTSHRVLRCAHRAGNERHALRLALDAGVDWIEVDVWYAHGRLHARHERAVWRLPLLYDKWTLRVRPRLLSLGELLRLVGDRAHVFVDVKGLHPRLPGAIVRAVRESNALGRVSVCGQYWPVLDAIGREEAGIGVFHSLGRPEHFAVYRERTPVPPGGHVEGVSAARWLLTEEDVRTFQTRGLRVVAWTVNSEAEAAKLAGWGVDGITSDRLDLLAALP